MGRTSGALSWLHGGLQSRPQQDGRSRAEDVVGAVRALPYRFSPFSASDNDFELPICLGMF